MPITHTGERPQCENSFKQAAKISNHKKVHTSKMPFVCKMCSCIFKHYNAKRHFRCLRCESSSNQKSNFRAHAKMHVDIESETFYIFKMCPSKFDTNNKLKIHMTSHKEKTKSCHQFKATFRNASSLRTHST